MRLYSVTCTVWCVVSQLVVMATLSLAAKAKEMPVKLSDVVNTCYRSSTTISVIILGQNATHFWRENVRFTCTQSIHTIAKIQFHQIRVMRM